MTDSIGTVTYIYDALGNLIVEDGLFANDTLYYDYTSDRQLAAITSSFYTVEYAYDNLGRLSTVIGAEGTNTYAYAAAGTLWTNLTLANGTTAERSFDPLLRLTNLVNRADAGVLSSFALTLDDADQRTQVIREDGKIYTYSYDAIGQLTNASAALPDGTPWPGYQFSYAYDATGNPIEQNKNGLVYSNSFNNLNQNVDTIPSGTLTVLGEVNYPFGTATVNNVQAQIAPDGTFAAPGIPIALGTNTLASVFTDPFGRTTNTETTVTISPKTYGYDLNGNLTNDSRFVYSWDYENRLTAVHDAQTGALVQENRYDAFWRRREKIEYAPDGTAITNRYIYKDWLVLVITDSTGTLLENYYHGADLSGYLGGAAGGIGGILTSTHTNANVNYHYDYNGNISILTSPYQAKLFGCLYAPFGSLLVSEYRFIPRYQFSTKEVDSAVGLIYFGFRYYAPIINRWINSDPIKERGGKNLKQYCFNNPISNVDSHGKDVAVEKNENEITITLNITIYYADDRTQNDDVDLGQVAQKIKQRIEDEWNAGSWTYDCCTVVFVANVHIANQIGPDGLDDDNLIAISSDPELRDYVLEGNRGCWSACPTPDDEWVYAHEAGHLMGLDDDYTDDPDMGSVANPGHEGHMMAEGGKPVVEHEVMDILDNLDLDCSDN